MTPTLRLLIWPDYIDPKTLAQFTQETGIAVSLDIVPSAIDLMERVQKDVVPADVIVPPDYAVHSLVTENRLRRLDHAKLPHLKHLKPEFIKGRAHDPNTEFSVPKDWGTTGFMYREDVIDSPPTSWRDFWSLAQKHSGKVTILDSLPEVIGAALKMHGHSYNSIEPEALKQARSDIAALQMHVISETNYRPLLESGAAVLSMGWNGDALALQAKGIPVRYVVPKEGSQKWEDDWAIPVGAANVAGAYQFIDFMLRPAVALQEALYTRYATPNQGAYDLLDQAIRDDTAIYPSAETLEKLEWGLPLGEEGMYRRQTYVVI